MRTQAPAKLNLCLYVGHTREDGRHELVSVMTPLDLHDTVTLGPGETEDEVVCPGVEGPNLAAEAIRLFREETGWDGPPVRIAIEKRIPVAAGLGGGSADAAAALRLVRGHSGLGDWDVVLAIADRLGSDVPSQVAPKTVLVEGYGERLVTIDPLRRSYGMVVLPSREALSTGAVYGRFDELGALRSPGELRTLGKRLRAGGEVPLVNDLEAASRSLCPAIDEAMDAARETGAEHVMVAGSGPTVVAFYPDRAAAEAAAGRLRRRDPAPVVTAPRD